MTAARTPRWRSVLNGLLLVVILVAAGLVLHTAPGTAESQAPMPVRGTIGEKLVGRNIAVRVNSIEIADAVTASNGWAGESSGTWVVVQASAEAVVDDSNGAALRTANLVIGDETFSASTRPQFGTIADQSLSVGIAMSGPLMFEIPDDLLDADAELQFAASADARLDSLIVVPVRLGSVDRLAATTTTEPVWKVVP